MTTMIRLASLEDGAALASIYRPAVVDAATSFETVPPDAAEMASRVRRTLERLPWLVAEGDTGVVGYAYAGPHRGDRPAYQWSVEVSAYVHATWHRGGVGRALYSGLFDVLCLQGFRNAYAGITLPNPASEAFHRSMGFELVGVYRKIGYKMGAWRDVAWSSRVLAPHDADPAPPVPIAAVAARAEFRDLLRQAAGRIRSGPVQAR